MLKQLAGIQHLVAALLATWLLVTSPWVVMLRRIPAGAGFVDYAHVGAGFAALLASLAFTITTLRGGGWRLYLPWAAGRLQPVGRDLGGLVRGRLPSAEGGGLFALIEGLLLFGFLAAAATGAGWFLAQGSAGALAWREWHSVAAWATGALLALHVLAASLHLLDFVRD